MAQMNNYPLGGDGVIVNLLYYLWSKDDDEKVPRVFVPDTVIFEFSQPKTWYFTARMLGTSIIKTTQNVLQFEKQTIFNLRVTQEALGVMQGRAWGISRILEGLGHLTNSRRIRGKFTGRRKGSKIQF